MLPLRKVGRDIGTLSDEELIEIQKEIIGAAWPRLKARDIFETEPLSSVGKRTWRKYTETDMGQALISMEGTTLSIDRTQLATGDVKIPVISKDFLINWRDIEAHRDLGEPILDRNGLNAARQVAEEENKLAFSGEYTGWRALGIEGLMTATGRNTKASAGAWPANAFTDINAAIGELETDGYADGPFVLCCPVAEARKLDALISSTTSTYRKALLENGIVSQIITDDSIFPADGSQDGACVVVPGKANFSLGIAADITTFTKQLANMNVFARVYEVVSVNIKRPTSICEITAIT